MYFGSCSVGTLAKGCGFVAGCCMFGSRLRRSRKTEVITRIAASVYGLEMGEVMVVYSEVGTPLARDGVLSLQLRNSAYRYNPPPSRAKRADKYGNTTTGVMSDEGNL